MESSKTNVANTRWPDWLKVFLVGLAVFSLLSVISSSAALAMARKFGRETPFLTALLDHFGRWFPWALLTPLIAAVATRWPIRKSAWVKPLGLHLLLSLSWLPLYLLLIISFEVIRGRFGWPTLVTQYKTYFGINLMGDYHWYWVILIAITAWHYALDLLQQQRETSALLIKNASLQKNLLEAQFQALKAQIQPHFLYNTHNTIGALIRNQQPQEALKVLDLLSRLLRRSLEGNPQQTITLAEELAFVDHYLAIQMIRFPNRLRVTYNIDEACRQALIPPMVLQPLVENAVHHGVVSLTTGDTIQIEASARQGQLMVRIINQTDPEQADSSGFSIGLKNTRSRLQHLYGDAQSLELEFLDETTVAATLTLPFGT